MKRRDFLKSVAGAAVGIPMAGILVKVPARGGVVNPACPDAILKSGEVVMPRNRYPYHFMSRRNGKTLMQSEIILYQWKEEAKAKNANLFS